MIVDFLERWANLQPERCQISQGGFCITDIEFQESYYLSCSYNPIDLAMLQSSLQLAIAAKDSRCRLENSSKAWHVTLGRPEPKSSNFEILVFGKNTTPAVAMLEAWVKFLQAEAKLAPQGEAIAQEAS